MNDNYIIKTEDNEYFTGWGRFGEITIKDEKDANLAYRMSRTVANRNLYKIEDFTHKKCTVVAV